MGKKIMNYNKIQKILNIRKSALITSKAGNFDV